MVSPARRLRDCGRSRTLSSRSRSSGRLVAGESLRTLLLAAWPVTALPGDRRWTSAIPCQPKPSVRLLRKRPSRRACDSEGRYRRSGASPAFVRTDPEADRLPVSAGIVLECCWGCPMVSSRCGHQLSLLSVGLEGYAEADGRTFTSASVLPTALVCSRRRSVGGCPIAFAYSPKVTSGYEKRPKTGLSSPPFFSPFF